MGLMGTSIVTSFLLAGHPVKAIAPISSDLTKAPQLIRHHLLHCQTSGLLVQPLESYLSRLIITEDYQLLEECSLTLECVVEEMPIKIDVYSKITAVVSADAIIASNTSAIPISLLQNHVSGPERFLGIHWGEPAYLSRFLEIICGAQTDLRYGEWAKKLAPHWGKEPTLLRKDVRGFVTNRLMYSVYREALTLAENGEATLEDIDKAFRYDAGSWSTLMGLLKRMDFEGLEDYATIFKNIFPQLSNREDVPPLMQKQIDQVAKGTQNAKGFYDYTPEGAARWNEAFSLFTMDIYNLAKKYPSNLAEEPGFIAQPSLPYEE